MYAIIRNSLVISITIISTRKMFNEFIFFVSSRYLVKYLRIGREIALLKTLVWGMVHVKSKQLNSGLDQAIKPIVKAA